MLTNPDVTGAVTSPGPAEDEFHPLPVAEADHPSFGATEHLHDFLSLLGLLVREPSVVGMEDAFFRVLRRELEELDVQVFHFQGCLVIQGKDPESLILSAHVDRHGLVCTGPNEFQYAAFIASNRGDLTGDSLSEQMLFNLQDRFRGQRVQAHIPFVGTYQGQGTITKSFVCPQRNNLIFEVDGLNFLQPGAPVAFLDRLSVSRQHISAQLDNVLSVAMIIHLFRQGFAGTALFTAQEEAGRSWRYALTWFQRQDLVTQRLLVLDTSPYPDREAAGAQLAVLRRKDVNGEFAQGITDELQQKCESLSIPYSHKDAYIESLNEARVLDGLKPLSLGRTELGRLVAATEGQINGTTLQIPTTGYHTASETASLDAVDAVLRLLASCVK